MSELKYWSTYYTIAGLDGIFVRGKDVYNATTGNFHAFFNPIKNRKQNPSRNPVIVTEVGFGVKKIDEKSHLHPRNSDFYSDCEHCEDGRVGSHGQYSGEHCDKCNYTFCY